MVSYSHRSKERFLHAPILFDQFVETLPHVRHQMELDDFGRDSSTTRVNGGKVVQKEGFSLEIINIRVKMWL